MFAALRTMMIQINTPSAAEVQGYALLARLDAEIATMAAAMQAADLVMAECNAEMAGLRRVAHVRLTALKEAAIAARAVRPEHIRHSRAAACLRDGANIAGLMGKAYDMNESAVQPMARVA